MILIARYKLPVAFRKLPVTCYLLPSNRSGFTLIELIISIALVVIISSAVYFAVDGALDSWRYCSDQLSLQKVLAETMDKVISGTTKTFGLKDSLEIIAGGKTRVEFIPPWVDDTHASANRAFTYTLNKRIKSGAPVPLGEIKMPETQKWRLVPVQVVPLEKAENTQVKLTLSVPEGSDLRFIYHPNWREEPDVIRRIIWDPKSKEIMMEQGDGIESISKNFFGVEILNLQFKYFTNSNEQVTDRDWVDEEDLQTISGVEVELEAQLGQYTQKLVRFVNLRNAPMRTGYLTLRKDMRIKIPDSKHIKAFLVTNLQGIANNDKIQLEAVPQSGHPWRVTITFDRIGANKPIVEKIEVEYPQQKIVYTEYPKSTVELGVNLMLLGNDGLYDYDDDEDVEDTVMLEGAVDLYVTEMTIEGAGLFIRP